MLSNIDFKFGKMVGQNISSHAEGPEASGADLRDGDLERCRRRESSVEEALIEMYLAGVSVRRVEDITEALWGTRVSPSTVSDLNKKIYATIEAWRNRPIEGEHIPPLACATNY